MIFKLRTSKRTQNIFETIQRREALAPYVLAKLALSLSLREEKVLSVVDFDSDTNGLELNRQTITGEYDVLYKSLICINEDEKLTDEEYFPKFIKAHLDRGAVLLEAEFKYGGKFIEHLANLDKSI